MVKWGELFKDFCLYEEKKRIKGKESRGNDQGERIKIPGLPIPFP